jgi:hypothetical protein
VVGVLRRATERQGHPVQATRLTSRNGKRKPIRIAITAGGLAGLALFGTGLAHADASQEQEACQLMDDPAGRDQGYAPAEYAFMLLRAKMSAQDARNVMSAAAYNYCPNHITDLPASWR